MTDHTISRRDALRIGGASVAAGLTLFADPAFVFPAEEAGEELVPFLDTPRTPPNRLDWETLDSWLTPQDQVFNVQHYGIPEFDTAAYQLEITGLVDKPTSLSLEDLKAAEAGSADDARMLRQRRLRRLHERHLQQPVDRHAAQAAARTGAAFRTPSQGGRLLRRTTPKRRRSAKERKANSTVEVPFGRSLSLEDALNMPLLLA